MVTYLLTTLLSLNLIASSIYLLFKGLLFWAKDRIDERFRYLGCIAVMLMFLIPFYQVLPEITVNNNMPLVSEQYLESGSVVIFEDPSFESDSPVNEGSETITEGFHLDFQTQKTVLVIWAVGAAMLALWYFSTLLRFRQRLSPKRAYLISNELQQLANLCAKECNLKQMPILRVSPDVQGPMLIGFLKPIVVMPVDGLTLEDAPMILKHELVHFKRHDLWWKLLGTVLQTVYWFNPIVWLLCKDFEFCAETSCDAEVVKNLDHDERKHYGYLLISYVQTHRNLKPVPGISFTPAHKKLKRRISVMLKGNKSRKAIATAIVCVLTVSSFALSAFAAENQKDAPRTIDGIVADKATTNASSDKTLNGEVQKDIPFAEKIDPNDGWNIENKGDENNRVFDPAQIDLPPLNISDDFREAVMRGEVEPFEVGEGVTVFTATQNEDKLYEQKDLDKTNMQTFAADNTSVVELEMGKLIAVNPQDEQDYTPDEWKSILDKIDRGEIRWED